MAVTPFVVVVLLVSDDALCVNDDFAFENEAEKVFDSQIAQKLYRMFAAEHNVVKLRASYWQTSCDESLVESPCDPSP